MIIEYECKVFSKHYTSSFIIVKLKSRFTHLYSVISKIHNMAENNGNFNNKVPDAGYRTKTQNGGQVKLGHPPEPEEQEKIVLHIFDQFEKDNASSLRYILGIIGIAAITLFGLVTPYYVNKQAKTVLDEDDIAWVLSKCVFQLNEIIYITNLDANDPILPSMKHKVYKKIAFLLSGSIKFNLSAIYGQHNYMHKFPMGIVYAVERCAGQDIDVIQHFIESAKLSGPPTKYLDALTRKYKGRAVFHNFRVHDFEFEMDTWDNQRDERWFEALMNGSGDEHSIYEEMQRERHIRHQKYLKNRTQH
eukprot:463033_1